MHIYYVAGVPYSDELYHHGTKGMKWGQRLYQYEDGSLTPLGKIHYGVKKAAAGAISVASKINAKRIEKKKLKNPSLMSDEELKSHLNRVNMEREYFRAREEIESKKTGYRAKQMVSRVLEKGGETLALKAIEAAGNSIVSRQAAKDDAAYAKKMAKQAAKDDVKYSKKMAEQAAKNKLMSDIIIDKGQRKQTRNDASSKIMRKTEKNFISMTLKELEENAKRYETLRKIENRYRGSNISNYSRGNSGGGGKKKG